ncbi:MAG: GNAT family N-acetyltransferase [Actinomycetota bacterium]|nr:GNAT family N-acetyltransferase [Actinomycetota bacterium]
MTIREGNRDDYPLLNGYLQAMFDELWQRPFRPNPIEDAYLEDKLVLVAEENGEPVGAAVGQANPNGTAHLNVIYVVPGRRREGTGKALLLEFASRMRAEGVEHLTLDVDTTNEAGIAVWERFGLKDYARRMSVEIEALGQRLEPHDAGESFASIHVQTDDERAIEQAVRKYVPRLGSSRSTVVAPPRNGWVAVYDELCDGDPKAARRLATELSHATGAVVVVFAVEDGQVVRYLLIERGSLVDEYLSVPNFYGPLPPGDAIALGANPTVVSRLTGADPARVKASARTAASPAELPPATDLLAELAEIFGIAGAGHGYDPAGAIDGSVTVTHR